VAGLVSPVAEPEQRLHCYICNATVNGECNLLRCSDNRLDGDGWMESNMQQIMCEWISVMELSSGFFCRHLFNPLHAPFYVRVQLKEYHFLSVMQTSSHRENFTV
jgi:hypothetical protein